MKVIIATNLYPPYARGGSERVARLSAEAFVRAGHEVIVVTAKPFKSVRALWPERSIENSVVVYRWFPLNFYFYAEAASKPMVVRLLWTFFDIFNVHSYFLTRWVLRREQPDLVVSHNLKGLGYTLACALARGPWRYVHVLHDVQLAHPTGLLYPATYQSELKRLPVRMHMACNRWLFGHVPVVVAPSQFLLDFYHALGFFKQARLVKLVNPIAATPRPSVAHEVINVISFEMERHKGTDVLLEAWRGITDKDVVLHLVGGGSEALMVTAQVRDDARVHVRGRLNEGDNEALWSTADVVVVPSLCLENAPTVISEALARGVYIIASKVGGIVEMTSLSSAARLVPPGDVSALTQALREILSIVRNGVRPAPVALPNSEEYIKSLLM